MILTLMASIMYWSLQQQEVVEAGESSPTPSSDTTTSTITTASEPSSTSSVNDEDEISSISGDVSSLNIDDNASDSTMSSQVESEEEPQVVNE